MAASISESETIQILLELPAAEIKVIQQQAKDVFFGAITSISALSQSTTFSREDAAVILAACRKALRLIDSGASAGEAPPSTLGHSMRFQQVSSPPGCTWGA